MCILGTLAIIITLAKMVAFVGLHWMAILHNVIAKGDEIFFLLHFIYLKIVTTLTTTYCLLTGGTTIALNHFAILTSKKVFPINETLLSFLFLKVIFFLVCRNP